MKKHSFFKLAFIALGFTFASQSFADTGFRVPTNYTIELVDGESTNFDYTKSKALINLTPGRHQVVLSFKGQFGSSRDSKLIQSTDPLVIDIYELQNNEVISFTYPQPRTTEMAEKYAKNQIIDLTDGKKKIAKNKADYFILKSEVGFTFLRDYKQELVSVNRLYAPNYEQTVNGKVGMTSYGAPTITASSASRNMPQYNTYQTMPSPGVSMEQDSVMSTSQTHSGANTPTYNELVRLYNKADDKTKLKFVKYVMSHE